MEEDLIEKISPAVIYLFFTMLGLVLLAVVIFYLYLIVEKIRETMYHKGTWPCTLVVQGKKNRDKEKLLLKEAALLRRAIIENTRNLERVWSNKEFKNGLEEKIRKEQKRLQMRLCGSENGIDLSCQDNL